MIVIALLSLICVWGYCCYSRVYRPKHYSKGKHTDAIEMNPQTHEGGDVEINQTQAIVAEQDDDDQDAFIDI